MSSSASSAAPAPGKESTQPSFREILNKSAASAVRGGTAGAVAMGANVAALMWMRTTVRHGKGLERNTPQLRASDRDTQKAGGGATARRGRPLLPTQTLTVLLPHSLFHRSTTSTAMVPVSPSHSGRSTPTAGFLVSTGGSCPPWPRDPSVALVTRRPILVSLPCSTPWTPPRISTLASRP
jgi:hypothetical protein